MKKTETFPSMANEKIKELSDALEELRLARKSRMDFLKKEVEEQDRVLAIMHEHQLDAYKDDDFDPPLEAKIVVGKEKVKIKLGGNSDNDDPD